MIIVQLKGGLGNQLFQYAAGRALAEKIHGKLKLDLTKFTLAKSCPHEIYGLYHFNIQAEIAEKSELEDFYINTIFGRIKRKFRKITNTERMKRFFEKRWFYFDPSLLELPDNVWLCGYWQSEKYFKDIEFIIRSDLSLKDALTPKSLVIAQKIATMQNTVSLHIRRGDYVTDTKTNNFLGILSIDYYKECIAILKKDMDIINIFVFSDDIKWCESNIHLILQTYEHENIINFYFVNHNDINFAWEDMYLMSLCEHNIIANSSFSWWGAYLNQYKNKKIFAPNKWIKDQGFCANDIIPDNWIAI